jgi:hypothetical protein
VPDQGGMTANQRDIFISDHCSQKINYVDVPQADSSSWIFAPSPVRCSWLKPVCIGQGNGDVGIILGELRLFGLKIPHG